MLVAVVVEPILVTLLAQEEQVGVLVELLPTRLVHQELLI